MTAQVEARRQQQPQEQAFADWLALGEELFGPDPVQWRFECPSCHDVASGVDFQAALEEQPRVRNDGTRVTASDVVGRECIGRTLGALTRSPQPYRGRGCDWCAYGLFSGPIIVIDGDRRMPAFRFAQAAAMTARSKAGHVVRSAAGLTVSLFVIAVLAVVLGGSAAADRARSLWGGESA